MPKISEQIRKANTANIIKKAKSGKTLTNAEIAAIENFEADQEQQAIVDNGGIVLTSAQMADLFDVTAMTISNWQKNGFPKIATNKYNLKACFRWWCENINPGASKEENNVRERYWLARAEAEEIKVARVKGELLKKDDIYTEFSRRAGDLKTALRALKYRLSGVLVGKSQDDIIQLLGQEIDEMLRNFCREGKYTPSTEIVENKAISASDKGTSKKPAAKKKVAAKSKTKKGGKKK